MHKYTTIFFSHVQSFFFTRQFGLNCTHQRKMRVGVAVAIICIRDFVFICEYVDAIFQINFSCAYVSLSSFLFFARFIYGSVYSMHQHFKVDICVNILPHHCMHYIKPKLAGNEIYLPDSLYVQNELSSPSVSFSLVPSCF